MTVKLNLVAGTQLQRKLRDVRHGQPLVFANLSGAPELPPWVEVALDTIYFRPPAGTAGSFVIDGFAKVLGGECQAPIRYEINVVAQGNCIEPQFTSALPALFAEPGQEATGTFTATGSGPLTASVDPFVENLVVRETSQGVFELQFKPPVGSQPSGSNLQYSIRLSGQCGDDKRANGAYRVNQPGDCPAPVIADADAQFTASSAVFGAQNWFVPVTNGPVEGVTLIGAPGAVSVGPMGSLGFTLVVSAPTYSVEPYTFTVNYRTRCGTFTRQMVLTVKNECVPGDLTGWPDTGSGTCANPTKFTYPEVINLVADGEWHGPFCFDNSFVVGSDVRDLNGVEVRQAAPGDGAADNTQCVMLRSTATGQGYFEFVIDKEGCSGSSFTARGTLTQPGSGGGGGGGCSGTPALAANQGIAIDMAVTDSVTFGLTSAADGFDPCHGMDPGAVSVSLSADGMQMTVQVIDASKLLAGANGPYYCIKPKCGSNVGSAVAGGVSNISGGGGSGGGSGGGGSTVDCGAIYASGPGVMVANGTENLVVNGNFTAADPQITFAGSGVNVSAGAASYDSANNQTTIPLTAANSASGSASVTLSHAGGTCVHSFQVSASKQLGEGQL